MLSTRQLVGVVILAMMLMLPGTTIQAQDGVLSYCGDLSAEDCALLQSAGDAMPTLDSASWDIGMKLYMGAVTDGSVDELEMSFNFQGQVAVEFDAFNVIDPDISLEEMTDMLDDSMEAYREGMESLEGQFILTADFPEDLGDEAELEDGTLEFRIVDGVLYVYVEDFDTDVDAAWAGIDLIELFEQDMDPADLEGLEEMDLSDLEELQDLFDNDFFGFLDDADFLEEFITVERLDDEQVDGQTMAVFQTSADYADAINSREFQDGLTDWILDLVEQDPSAEVSRLEVTLVVTLLTELIGEAELTTVQWIGVDDNYVYYSTTDFVLEFDFALLTDFAGSDMDGETDIPESFVIGMDIQAQMGDFNEPVEVEVPTDVEMTEPDEAMDPVVTSVEGPFDVCAATDEDCYSTYAELEQGISEDGVAYIGSLDAPVVIAEFGDFSCPHCATFHPTASRLIDDFVRTEQARFEWQPMIFVRPPYSENAASAAYCAGEQGAFGPYHHELFELQMTAGSQAFEADLLVNMAEAMGLDRGAFAACLDSERPTASIAAAEALFSELGLSGTPSVAVSFDNGDTWQVVSASYDAVSETIAASN